MPDLPCTVLVRDSTGQPWSMEVTARSLYSAIFAYNSQQLTGPQSLREYPRLMPETEIEVKLPDGREWRTTFAQAMRWANAVAERQAARWKRSA